jgi:ABC-type nitrate/sulfonate/bicarbonate transport system substrate-binding protein
MLKVDDWGVPPYYELILVANDGELASQRERIAGFLRATRRGYLEAMADPKAALAALQAASPEIDLAVETEGLQLLIPVWTDANGEFGTQTAQQWQDYAAWMSENGLIPADLDLTAAWSEMLPPLATPVP